jgi:hypothetical protein
MPNGRSAEAALTIFTPSIALRKDFTSNPIAAAASSSPSPNTTGRSGPVRAQEWLENKGIKHIREGDRAICPTLSLSKESPLQSVGDLNPGAKHPDLMPLEEITAMR